MAKWLRLTILTVVSTGLWCVGGVLLIWIQKWLPSVGIPLYVFSPIIVLCTIITGVIFCWNPPESPKGKKKVSIWTHLMRGLVVAVFILLSSIISGMGASDYAGLLTSFPAITLVTMLSVSISQDESVTCGAIGPLMLGYVRYSLLRTVYCLVLASMRSSLACCSVSPPLASGSPCCSLLLQLLSSTPFPATTLSLGDKMCVVHNQQSYL